MLYDRECLAVEPKVRGIESPRHKHVASDEKQVSRCAFRRAGVLSHGNIFDQPHPRISGIERAKINSRIFSSRALNRIQKVLSVRQKNRVRMLVFLTRGVNFGNVLRRAAGSGDAQNLWTSSEASGEQNDAVRPPRATY